MKRKIWLLNDEATRVKLQDAIDRYGPKAALAAFHMKPKFSLGQTVITPNAQDVLSPEDITAAIDRHVVGDWGDVSDEDWQENELSLDEGFRLFSVYHATNGTRFWVITEADRSATTVLLPEDY